MNRTTFAQHTGSLEILVGLLDAFQNDKEVRKAHEESLKLLALTDEQIAKVEELRNLTALNEAQIEELNKLKSIAENERRRADQEKQELEALKVSYASTEERLRKQAEKNESDAAKNEQVKKQQEGHAEFISKMKAEYLEKNAKLDEREKALDVRAEKILLREKAADL